MSHPVAFERSGRIGVIVIDNPPVNAISAGVTQGLIDALAQFEAASELDALVLCCAGRTWVAGGDIAAFEDPRFSAAPLNAFLARLEAQSRPVVASLHGTVLGGGLELAMACHARVAQVSTRLGMPEVRLGLLPGSLGTQRLPRLVGPELALDMITSGRMISAAQACQSGLVDGLAEGEARANGLAAAQALVDAGTPPRRASALPVRPTPAGLFDTAEANAARRPGWPPLSAIIRCVRASLDQPFAEGERVEAAEFAALVASPSSKRCVICSLPSERPPRFRASRATPSCGR